jgi:nucleotidyltransferase substrate binding protein (TIGR01987 family)
MRGSRDAIKNAYKYGLLEDVELWFKMLEARNLTAHTYDESLAKEMLVRIAREFHPELERLFQVFKKIESHELGEGT